MLLFENSHWLAPLLSPLLTASCYHPGPSLPASLPMWLQRLLTNFPTFPLVFHNVTAQVMLVPVSQITAVLSQTPEYFPSSLWVKVSKCIYSISHHLAPPHLSEPTPTPDCLLSDHPPPPPPHHPATARGFSLVRARVLFCSLPQFLVLHTGQDFTYLPPHWTLSTKNTVWYTTGFAKWLRRFGH